MRDLFGNEIEDVSVRINIYADEIQSKKCPYTQDDWFYIGIIVENENSQLLEDIKNIRYYNNFNETSSYFEKNNRIIHWVKVNDVDSKNICMRWLEYILDPSKSEKAFYVYVLGINNSKLNRDEFSDRNKFNIKYNRFFRSAVLYAVKSYFPNKHIIVKHIYHEEGQQQKHEYFPWHCISKIETEEEHINFECDSITFLPKSHRENHLSNIVQLCDLFLGVCTSTLHGIVESNRSKYKTELIDIFLPLFQRMINEPYNKNSSYAHANRLMIRFFPKEQTSFEDPGRFRNQFFTKRRLYYVDQISGQFSLFSSIC